MINLNAIDRVKQTVASLNHTLLNKKLLGEFESKDFLVSDILLKPDGIVGAFFYTLNIVCMELHPPMTFCPISISVNRQRLDNLEAKTISKVNPNTQYGVNELDEAQIDALTFATIDRLFKPVLDASGKKILGASYQDCYVYTAGGNCILPFDTEIVVAYALSKMMQKPSYDFVLVKSLISNMANNYE